MKVNVVSVWKMSGWEFSFLGEKLTVILWERSLVSLTEWETSLEYFFPLGLLLFIPSRKIFSYCDIRMAKKTYKELYLILSHLAKVSEGKEKLWQRSREKLFGRVGRNAPRQMNWESEREKNQQQTEWKFPCKLVVKGVGGSGKWNRKTKKRKPVPSCLNGRERENGGGMMKMLVKTVKEKSE